MIKMIPMTCCEVKEIFKQADKKGKRGIYLIEAIWRSENGNLCVRYGEGINIEERIRPSKAKVQEIEQEARENAEKKLQSIINRCGDEDGERRKPYYLKQLIQEAKAAISWKIFTTAFNENAPATPTKVPEATETH